MTRLREIRRPWTQQPHAVCRADTDRFPSLLLAWSGALPLYDAVSQSNGYIAGDSNQITSSLDASGVSAQFSGAAVAAGIILARKITLPSNAPWTIAWSSAAEGVSTNGMILGEYNTANSWIRIDKSANRIIFTNATGAGVALTSTTLTADPTHWLLMADGSGSVALYRNGKYVSSGSATTSFVLNSIGYAYNLASYALKGSVNYCFAFATDLSDLAMEFVYNPWQVFAPQRIFVPMASGAPTLPTLSAATYVPGSLTSSGFRPRVTAS